MMKKLLQIIVLLGIVSLPVVYAWHKPSVQVPQSQIIQSKVTLETPEIPKPSKPIQSMPVTPKASPVPVIAEKVDIKVETPPVIDVCAELDGIQTIVPLGYIKYGTGPCITNQQNNTNQQEVSQNQKLEFDAKIKYEDFIKDLDALDIKLTPLRTQSSALIQKYSTECLSSSNTGTLRSVEENQRCRGYMIENITVSNEINEIQSQFMTDHKIYSLETPTALCNDYTYSYSQNNSGTCSYHGGVLIWF